MEFKEDEKTFEGLGRKDLENVQIIEIAINFGKSFLLITCLKKGTGTL